MRLLSPSSSPRKAELAAHFGLDPEDLSAAVAAKPTRLLQRRVCSIIGLLALTLVSVLCTAPVKYTRLDRLTLPKFGREADATPAAGRLIVTTMDETHWHAAFNWLVFANRALPRSSRIIVGTHSASLARDLARRGMSSLYAPLLSGNKTDFFSWRLALLNRVIQSTGHGVLNLDSDTVMLRDIWDEIERNGHGADIVASRGWSAAPETGESSAQPKDVNLGVAFIANTPAARAFLLTAERDVARLKTADDHATINALLDEHLRGSSDGQQWAYLSDGSLSVALIPTELVQHTPRPRLDTDPAIVHVQMQAVEGLNTWDKLGAVGLWCLRDGWEQVWFNFVEERKASLPAVPTVDSWRHLAEAFSRPGCVDEVLARVAASAPVY